MHPAKAVDPIRKTLYIKNMAVQKNVPIASSPPNSGYVISRSRVRGKDQKKSLYPQMPDCTVLPAIYKFDQRYAYKISGTQI